MKYFILFAVLVTSIIFVYNFGPSFAEETKTIFIGPNLVDCVGVGPQKCMQIKDSQNSPWQNFYDKIEGFNFVEGYNYKLVVQITDVENPPADASSKKYSLVEIIEKNSTNRHIPYQNMCAPGFVPLGQICVLNDRCGPGAYPGKVCVMDNKVQSYLKPLKQGSAGIAADAVICAEPLELVFKHDASPACVKPETKDKLEMRGWYLEKPPIACTKEYSPVCGMDNKTYGNMCTLNADHMGFKYQGECKEIEKPSVCTADWRPVCGMDGETYGNLCMLNAAEIALKHQGECITLTEFELDQKYHSLQDSISAVSRDFYNGMYNGKLPLDKVLQTLQTAKGDLQSLYEQYDLLDDEQKTDRQIEMRFSSLGKMGFASIDSQINRIKNQLENPPPEKTTEEIQMETEKSFSVKFNSIRNVIQNYEDDFEDEKYVGLMAATSMRNSLLQSQFKIFELYDDLENKKDLISKELYQEVSSELLNLNASVRGMWLIINEHIGISSVSADALGYSWKAPEIDNEKGFFVDEIADGVYWLVGSGYQTIFLTTGEGVIAIDAPAPIGDNYLAAISDVTEEPITHMIYSHHHQDHTGAAGMIFPSNIEYISHKQTADVLIQEDDQARPIPTITFEDSPYTLSVGDQTVELHHVGNFHSDGDLIILIPQSKVAMIVDLFRPDSAPFRAFGVTPDMDQYIKTHDMLVNEFDFDLLVSGHTGKLATKEHIKTNKQFTLDVMNNIKNAINSNSENPIEECVDMTSLQWGEKLDLGQYMVEHCQAMSDYVLSQDS